MKGGISVEDTDIVKLFFERDEKAISELDKKYGALCLAVSMNILSDRRDAQECVSDAYLGVWNTVPPEKPNPLRSYVCKITRNCALKKYRFNTAEKRGGFYEASLDELAECVPSRQGVESEYGAKELSEEINKFLSSLDEKSRVMFVRRYWYAEPVGAVAERLNTSGGFVSVRLTRIRRKLREFLIEEGFYL